MEEPNLINGLGGFSEAAMQPLLELQGADVPASTPVQSISRFAAVPRRRGALFFGRESQVDTMVDKLARTRFLAVVGTPGSGKSSLVNSGLRPALHRD